MQVLNPPFTGEEQQHTFLVPSNPPAHNCFLGLYSSLNLEQKDACFTGTSSFRRHAEDAPIVARVLNDSPCTPSLSTLPQPATLMFEFANSSDLL